MSELERENKRKHRIESLSHTHTDRALVERGHVARGYDFKAKVDDTFAKNVHKHNELFQTVLSSLFISWALYMPGEHWFILLSCK